LPSQEGPTCVYTPHELCQPALHNSRVMSSTCLSPAGFRAIDLTCLLAAPLFVGLTLTGAGSLAGALLLALYCAMAWLPELVLLRMALARSPQLRYEHRIAVLICSAEDCSGPQHCSFRPELRQMQQARLQMLMYLP
jgi:hypothetical protein